MAVWIMRNYARDITNGALFVRSVFVRIDSLMAMTQHMRRLVDVAIFPMEKEPDREVNDLRLPQLMNLSCLGSNAKETTKSVLPDYNTS